MESGAEGRLHRATVEERTPHHDHETDQGGDQRAAATDHAVEHADEDDGQQRDKVHPVEALEILEDLVATVENDRRRDGRKDRHHRAADPPRSHYLVVAGIRLECLLVDPQREERGTGVQHRVEGGQDRAHEHRGEEPGQSRRQDQPDQ